MFLHLLDEFDRDVLFAFVAERDEVHLAPDDVVIVLDLFVHHDVARLEQRVHRVAPHVNGSVAAGQVGDRDIVDRGVPVGEDRYQAGHGFEVVERYFLPLEAAAVAAA